MTANAPAVRHRYNVFARQAPRTALAIGLLVWMALIAVRGAILALQTFGLPVAGEPQRNFSTTQMVWAAVVVYLICFVVTVAARAYAKAATIPVAAVTGGLVVLGGAIATSTVGSLLVVFAIFALSWLVGDRVLPTLPATASIPLARIPIAIGLGQGILGLLLLLLADFGFLNVATVTVVTAALLLFSLAGRWARLRDDLPRAAGWRPQAPGWFMTVVIGMVTGLVSFALLAALVPETQSDAIRQHLPIAREIWQTGSAPAFEPMASSRAPIQAHLLFAIAFGVGGAPAAKLVQTLVGLTAILGVAAIAWACAGRAAAFLAAVIFTTMPIVLWELGHAYLDLFPVLYTVAALLCVLVWERSGLWRWLVYGGALAGFGFATKVTMLWMIGAIAVAIFLVGRSPWRWRDRLYATVAFGLGNIVIVPWLLRSYAVAGLVPGLNVITERLIAVVPWLHIASNQIASQALGVAAPVEEIAAANAASSGQSPLDFVLLPWQLTFHGELYHSQGAGDIGILLLILLPLILFVPRTRAVALLAITAIVSYFAWWNTTQITRHLLPTLAIVAVLVAVGASRLMAGSTPVDRWLATATKVSVILGCVAVPLLFLPNWKTGLPVDLLLGRETAADYVARDVPSAGAILQAGDQLPADAPVAYFGIWEGPQIYTEARLVYLRGRPLGETPDVVLWSLDQGGMRYLVWNRPESSLDDWRSAALSTPFLRDHTRILAGDQDSYVFAILPDEGLTWGEKDPPQLLQDPELDKVGRKGDVWTAEGKVKAQDGGVPLRPRDALAQQVPVTPGRAYVLTATSSCSDPEAGAQLTLRWLDDKGVELDAVSETVIPGTEPSEQFIWRRAPQNAASVSAEVTTARGGEGATCTFDAVSLLELS